MPREHHTTAVLAAALLAMPQVGGAQSWSVEAGAAFATPILEDGNGTRVTLGPAATLGAAVAPAAWRVGPARVSVEGRVATAAVHLADDGVRWRGGRAWQVDVLAMAMRAEPARVTPLAGVGLTWLHGSVRVLDDLGARPRPVIAGGALLRPQATSRTALSVVAQGLRVSPAAGDAGGVLRVLLTVRHAW